MEDKIFTLIELVRYLKIPKGTIYKLSQKGVIPSFKIGKQLRFRKSSLDLWLMQQENKISPIKQDADLNVRSAAEPRKKNKSILLVEDDNLVVKTLVKFLKLHGYNVEAAVSGEEALAKLEDSDFDLAVVDVRMPGIDGIETIRRIRNLNTTRNRRQIPEILISGYLDTRAHKEAEKLGITGFIYKPFMISEFIKNVDDKIDSNSG